MLDLAASGFGSKGFKGLKALDFQSLRIVSLWFVGFLGF